MLKSLQLCSKGSEAECSVNFLIGSDLGASIGVSAIAPLYYILRQTNRSDQLCTMPTATTTPTTNTTHTLRLPCFTYMCVCVCVCMSACGRVRAHIHCGYRHLSHTHVPHIRGKCNRTKPSNKPHVCCAKVKYTHLFSEQRRRPDWCAYAFLCALRRIAHHRTAVLLSPGRAHNLLHMSAQPRSSLVRQMLCHLSDAREINMSTHSHTRARTGRMDVWATNSAQQCPRRAVCAQSLENGKWN